MKKSILLFAIIIIISQISYASNIKITPIMLNFKGVVASGNTVVAFADFGSVLISRDDTESWQQVRVFDGGTIKNIFIHDNELTAINDRGEIAVSPDTGQSWSLAKSLGDSVLAAIEYPGGYFLRMRNKLITLTPDFSIAKEIIINSPYLKRVGFAYQPKYDKSILYANDKFIAEFDSSTFIRFDTGLAPIDTLKLLEHIELGDYMSGYRMLVDSDYIYMRYSYAGGGVLRSSVFRTRDFKNVEKYIDLNNLFSIYSIRDGIYFSVNKTRDDKYLIDTTKLYTGFRSGYYDPEKFYRKINEFTVSNNKQIIVGDRKILEIFDLKDSTLEVVSAYLGFSYRDPPDQVGGDTLLFYSQRSPIYKSDNAGLTFLPTVDKTYPGYDKNFRSAVISYRHYDSKSKRLYLFGEHSWGGWGDIVWTSDDLGRSFDSTRITGISFGSGSIFIPNAIIISKIQQRGDEFIETHAVIRRKNDTSTAYSNIITLKEDGRIVKHVRMAGANSINYSYSKDTSTYLAQSYNVIDSTSNVIYSSDGGESWEVIHKFPINQAIVGVNDIEVNGREYMAFVHLDYINYRENFPEYSGAFLDVVDKETNQFTSIASWGPNPNPEYTDYGISITSDGGKAYIVIRDTLFVVDNLFDKSTWGYYLLPESGRILRQFKKFGGKFFCWYADASNPGNMSWIEPIGPITGVKKQTIDYLYSYPPYPNPARTTVRALIYWDAASKIDDDHIGVYDIFGAKVGGREDITIDYQSAYSGFLIWDCTNVGSGLYFIQIKRGSKSKTLKIIVNK